MLIRFGGMICTFLYGTAQLLFRVICKFGNSFPLLLPSRLFFSRHTPELI